MYSMLQLYDKTYIVRVAKSLSIDKWKKCYIKYKGKKTVARVVIHDGK